MRRVPLRRVSEKQKARLREYRIVRKEYLEEVTICEYPRCTHQSTEIHHKKGRIGPLLHDKR